MTQTFTRMDKSTAEEWAQIGVESMKSQQHQGDTVLQLLRMLSTKVDGFAVDQLTHCLQTATLAERAGADKEVVVASLCHDIGKVVSVPNHGAIAAEILKPYVREDVYFMIKHHQDFQGRHYYQHFGGDPNARDQYEGQPWFDLAAEFADDWDQIAFDPDYDTEPLEHFEPLVMELFASPKSL
jgi:predicted HD phosphohydrolase